MLCGHGRCFSLIDQDKELYREAVLYGCLNDITYDLQCEGSRAQFMYNLALEYDDYEYFLNAVIEKFRSPIVNEDWHIINHLCDILDYFAQDNNDKSAENAIEAKYHELYDQIMTLRWSKKAHDVQQCYEYLAIVVLQSSDFERAVGIFRDIGAYFIRCRHFDDEELKWRFGWFLHNAENEYGDDLLTKKLDELCQNSKEIRRFVRVMTVEREHPRSERPQFTADLFIEKARSGKLTRRDVIDFRRSKNAPSEPLKLANAAIAEDDPEIKAGLLKAFTISSQEFPLDADILAGYAESENDDLRSTAMDALLYVKFEKSHDIAINQLEENYSSEALMLLIHSYTDNDKQLLMKYLDKLEIDFDNNSGWHGVISEIIHNMEVMPIEAIMFVYEKSMCSCCRERAVEELIRRDMLTDELLAECLMDCNSDIREAVKSLEQALKVFGS